MQNLDQKDEGVQTKINMKNCEILQTSQNNAQQRVSRHFNLDFEDLQKKQYEQQKQNSSRHNYLSQKKQNTQNDAFSSNLPPPNPILQQTSREFTVKTVLNFKFKKLVDFNALQTNNIQLQPVMYDCAIKIDDQKQNSNKQQKETTQEEITNQVQQKSNSNGEIINQEQEPQMTYQTLHQKYTTIQDKQVFQKIDNSDFNTVPFNTKKYLSGLFCDLRKILQEQDGQITDQDYKSNTVDIQQEINNINFKLTDKQTELQQQKEGQDFKQQIQSKVNQKHQPNDLNYLLPQDLLYSSQITQPKPSINQDLQFDSNFESGNLFAAYKISDNEYDLVLQNDINSKGNTQWFFFSIAKTTKNQKVRLNIVNLMKNDSLFNYGMQPVCFSLKQKEKGWHRCGTNISYTKSNIVKDGVSLKENTPVQNLNNNNQLNISSSPIKRSNEQKGLLYQLSFDLQFYEENDKLYIAHCYPYTYSHLNQFLDSIIKDPKRSVFVKRKILCKTLVKNNCDLLIITSNSKQYHEKKYGVVFTGRQHPGETAGSIMVEGIIKFLTDPDDPIAEYLRRKCIFKIIPMVNPDGVIHGNYRCNISGVDLNRQWEDTSQMFHPTVFYIKQLIENFQKERQLLMVCDLHGHSKHMNSFFYGNPWEQDQSEPRIIPLIASKLNQMISYKQSTFSLNAQKNSTMRQSIFYQSNIPQVYTFEASFYGWKKDHEKKHFTYECFQNLGIDLCKSISRYLQIYTTNSRVFSIEELDNNPQFREFDNDYYEKSNKNNNKTNDLKQDLMNNQQLLENPSGYDSGSDSNPSEDELNQKEIKSLNTNKKKIKGKNREFNLSTHSPSKCRCCKNAYQHSLKSKEQHTPIKGQKYMQPIQLIKSKQKSNYNSPEKPNQFEQNQKAYSSQKQPYDSPYKRSKSNSKYMSAQKSSQKEITYADASCQTDELSKQELKFIEQQEKQLIQNRKIRKQNNKSLYNPYTQNQRANKLPNNVFQQRNNSQNSYQFNPNQTVYQSNAHPQQQMDQQKQFNQTNSNFNINQNINLQLNSNVQTQNSLKFQQQQGNLINGPDISVSILIGKQGFSFKEERKYDRKKKIYLIDKSCQTFIKLEDLFIIIKTQINNLKKLNPKADKEELLDILFNKNKQKDNPNSNSLQIYNFVTQSDQPKKQSQQQRDNSPFNKPFSIEQENNNNIQKNEEEKDTQNINIKFSDLENIQNQQKATKKYQSLQPSGQNTNQNSEKNQNNLFQNQENKDNDNNDISVVFDNQAEIITDQNPSLDQKEFLKQQNVIESQNQNPIIKDQQTNSKILLYQQQKRAQTSSVNQRNRNAYLIKNQNNKLLKSVNNNINNLQGNARYKIKSSHVSNNNISTNNFIIVQAQKQNNQQQQQTQSQMIPQQQQQQQNNNNTNNQKEQIFHNVNLQNLLNSNKPNISNQQQIKFYTNTSFQNLEGQLSNIQENNQQVSNSQQFDQKQQVKILKQQQQQFNGNINTTNNQSQNSQYNSYQNLNYNNNKQLGNYRIISQKKDRSSNSLHLNNNNNNNNYNSTFYNTKNNFNNQISQNDLERVDIGNKSQDILNQTIIKQLQNNNNRIHQSQFQQNKSKNVQNPIKIQQQIQFYQQQSLLQQQSINLNQNDISFQKQNLNSKRHQNNIMINQYKINNRNNKFSNTQNGQFIDIQTQKNQNNQSVNKNKNQTFSELIQNQNQLKESQQQNYNQSKTFRKNSFSKKNQDEQLSPLNKLH